MGKDNKLVIIALSIVCFLLLYSTVAFYVMEEGEKGKKSSLQKKHDEVVTVKQDLEAKLKESEMQAVELKTRLKTQEETITAVTQRLDEEKAANSNDLLKIQERESEVRGMKTSLENERAEKNSILKKIESTNEENIDLKTRLDNILKTKEEMDRKAKELVEKEGVSLGTIVVDQKDQKSR